MDESLIKTTGDSYRQAKIYLKAHLKRQLEVLIWWGAPIQDIRSMRAKIGWFTRKGF